MDKNTLTSGALGVSWDERKGTFTLFDKESGREVRNARFSADGVDSSKMRLEYIKEDILETPLGRLPALRVQMGMERRTCEWQVCIDSSRMIFLFRIVITDRSASGNRLHEFHVVKNGALSIKDLDPSEIQTLDGLSGAGETQVMRGVKRESPNNLLVTGATDGGRFAVVGGGLTYEDFAKYVVSSPNKSNPYRPKISLLAKDPVGRGMETFERWEARDWFYLSISDDDPFLALENYADAVRAANKADPTPYYFPTVCAWYASMPLYGGGEYMNDTAGTVREVEFAGERGFLKYAPVAVRLVPDTYDGTSSKHEDAEQAGFTASMYSKDRNTEQGWWDDAHWQLFRHYVEPYETSAKWAQAVRDRGGIPLTYVQTGHVSYDYAKRYPGHMIGNDISRLDEIFIGHNPYVTFDYTDPDFAGHLRKVWKNLGDAGVAGVFFDYPNQGWIETGGFEDPKATTASAYRRIFAFAAEGLPKPSWIQERNVARKVPYLDVTVGLVDSQRVWGDTDGISLEMIRMCALRWYKTRKLFSYDTDAKNLIKIAGEDRDRLRQVLTLLYLLTGRILLANSFRDIPDSLLHDLSRIYPGHREPLTPRPLDAFLDKPIPQIFGMRLSEDHYTLVLFNPLEATEQMFPLSLSDSPVSGGAGLDPGSSWLAWDFWNDTDLGEVNADDKWEQAVRPNEARVINLRRNTGRPRLIASDRHLLQGFIEVKSESWSPDENALRLVIRTVPDEPLKLVFHTHGKHLESLEAPDCQVSQSASCGDSRQVVVLQSGSTSPVSLSLFWSA